MPTMKTSPAGQQSLFEMRKQASQPLQQTPYTPKYSKKSPLGGLIDQMGKYLAPTKAFTDTMTYDQYAAPQQEAFNWWSQNVYRPEFERNTLNPYRDQLRTNMAVNNSWMQGNALENRNREIDQVMQPYYDTLDQANVTWQDMVRQGYNQLGQDYYGSPTTYTNIGL